MKRHIILLLVALLSLPAAGCGGVGDPAGTSRASLNGASGAETTAPASDVSPKSEATTAPAASVRDTGAEPLAENPVETPLVADAEMGGGSSFEADSILAVRHGVHEGYERVVLDLGTGAEPARMVPEWRLTSPTGDGLLRVELPSVSATDVTDGRFGGALLKDFHVVRAPEDGMFVDVFSGGAFTYRVVGLSDPARLVVDFKPSEEELGMPLPAEGGKTVLTQPRRGERVEGPLTVSGYSRNFEANNTIILTDAEGEVLERRSVGGNDWSATWGYFEATLDPPAFSGKGTLRVGVENARDGSFEGVEIPVRGTGG